MENLETYLQQKGIDPVKFKKAEPSRWEEWDLLFQQMHPNSFRQHKLFLLNPIRRKYPAKKIEADESSPKAKKPMAKMMPKIKK